MTKLDTSPEPAKVKTVTVTWHGRTWQIRNKPSMVYLDALDQKNFTIAIKAIIGDTQYAEMLAMDVDIEGDDGLNGFLEACNKAWNLGSGN